MEKVIFSFLLFSASLITAQDNVTLLESARKAYFNGKYEDAVNLYRKLDGLTGNSGKYSSELAQSLYRQQKFEESRAYYSKKKDKAEASDMNFNIGNTYFNEGNYEEAINSYRKALKINPNDKEARHNLSISMRKKSQKNNKAKGEKSRQNDTPAKNDKKDNSSQKNNQPNQAPPVNGDQSGKENQKKTSNGSGPDENQMSNKDIEKRRVDKMLENLALDEMKTKSKVNNAKVKNRRIAKPW